MRLKLYVDMDGVLAYWNADTPYSVVTKKGYFRNLRPTKLVNSIKEFSEVLDKNKNLPFSVEILSAVINENAKQEKIQWLKDNGLGGLPVNFVQDGVNKADAISYDDETINVLLDDYSKNLFNFVKANKNNYGIKYYNSINGTHGLWEQVGGYSLYWKDHNELMKSPLWVGEELVCKLLKICLEIYENSKTEKGLSIKEK